MANLGGYFSSKRMDRMVRKRRAKYLRELKTKRSNVRKQITKTGTAYRRWQREQNKLRKLKAKKVRR